MITSLTLRLNFCGESGAAVKAITVSFLTASLTFPYSDCSPLMIFYSEIAAACWSESDILLIRAVHDPEDLSVLHIHTRNPLSDQTRDLVMEAAGNL